MTDDEARELLKVRDVLHHVAEHLHSKDHMNAHLHLSPNVRPTPLSVAVDGALEDIDNLLPKVDLG